MPNRQEELSLNIFLVLLIIIIAVVLVVKGCQYSADKRVWNDGHCSCGGNWVYDTAVGHMYGTDYVYVCDSCGSPYEFDNKMDVDSSEINVQEDI